MNPLEYKWKCFLTPFYDLGVIAILLCAIHNYIWIPIQIESEKWRYSNNEGVDTYENSLSFNVDYLHVDIHDIDFTLPIKYNNVVFFERDIDLNIKIAYKEKNLDCDLSPLESSLILYETEQDHQEVYDIVEIQAEPIGGYSTFYEVVQNNLQLPREFNIQGRVYIQFIVEKSGALSNAKALKGLGPVINQSVIDAVKKSSKWKPGIVNNKKVRQRIVLPIKINT